MFSFSMPLLAQVQLEALRSQQEQYHTWLVQCLESAASASASASGLNGDASGDDGDTAGALYALYASAAGRSYLHCLKVWRV